MLYQYQCGCIGLGAPPEISNDEFGKPVYPQVPVVQTCDDLWESSDWTVPFLRDLDADRKKAVPHKSYHEWEAAMGQLLQKAANWDRLHEVVKKLTKS